MRAAAIFSAAVRPSMIGILMSRMTRSGSQLLGQPHRGLAVSRLADHVVALLDEHLPEVEPDQGLVLGDENPPALPLGHAHS